MFIPSDDALWKYFTQGGGLQLIETYGDPNMVYESVEDLYKNIDNIPLGTLQSLINIIMIRSFVGSVPSKMTKLRDDAQEQLFYAEDIEKIDTCLLASNVFTITNYDGIDPEVQGGIDNYIYPRPFHDQS